MNRRFCKDVSKNTHFTEGVHTPAAGCEMTVKPMQSTAEHGPLFNEIGDREVVYSKAILGTVLTLDEPRSRWVT